MTKLQLVAFFESDLLRGWCEFRDQSHYKKNKTKQSNLDYFEHFYTVTLADICTQPNMMKHDKTTPNKIYKWKYIFWH